MNSKRLFRILSILIVIPLALSLSAGGQVTQWRFERIDAGRTIQNVTNSSFKLYNSVPSVVYGSDHLYYAVQVAGEDFEITTVDDDWGVGKFASLAIRPDNGYPRISYYDETNEQLKYAEYSEYFGSPVWSTRIIDSGGNGTAIALDNSPLHLPHIAYTQLDGHVWHAWVSCGGIFCLWNKAEVDNTVYAGGLSISLAIDSSDHLHLAYYDNNSSTLHYAYYDGSNWSKGQISDPFGATTYGSEPSIAVDSYNQPAIVYETDSSINYAWKTGVNWTDWDFIILYEDTEASGYPSSPSLQLPNDDLTQPWISFIDGDSYLRLAVYGEGICPGTTDEYDCPYVDYITNYKDVSSLVVDTSEYTNLSRIISIKSYSGEVDYIFETESSWASQDVDAPTNFSQHNSLVADTSGPHISYYDSDISSLKYAEIDNTEISDCGVYGRGDRYDCTAITYTGSEYGWDMSIDLDLAGNPHIALYDYENKILKYASLDTSWSSVIIDNSTPDIGRYASLAFSPTTGLAGIAYKDDTNGYLKYAEELASPYTGGNCGPSTHWKCVDILLIGDGGWIDLDIDPYGIPFISFVDGNTMTVKVASYVGSGGSCPFNQWQCETISGTHTTNNGETSILAESSSGIVMVSFYDAFSWELLLASFSYASGWVHELVDDGGPGGDVGSQNSLTAINGVPIIAYFDENYSDLKLARVVTDGSGNCGASNHWYCETLDSAGRVGYDPSIAHNASGQLLVSYLDVTNGDLKLAYQTFPFYIPLIKKP